MVKFKELDVKDHQAKKWIPLVEAIEQTNGTLFTTEILASQYPHIRKGYKTNKGISHTLRTFVQHGIITEKERKLFHKGPEFEQFRVWLSETYGPKVKADDDLDREMVKSRLDRIEWRQKRIEDKIDQLLREWKGV